MKAEGAREPIFDLPGFLESRKTAWNHWNCAKFRLRHDSYVHTDMAPSLTAGSINRILNGENVPNAVLQIIDWKNFQFVGYNKYHLLLSDGITAYPFAVLGTHDLIQMADNKELEMFTVVRLYRYNCVQNQSNPKFIIILNLTVLFPGNEINERLGNPTIFQLVSSAKELSQNRMSGTVQTSPKSLFQPNPNLTRENWKEPEFGTISDMEMVKFLNLESYVMVPSLSTGSISRILNGEHVPNAVIQILDLKNIPGERNDTYRLLISDGITGFPYSMLGTHLHQMVADKELEKFSVVRLERYIFAQVEFDHQVIILMNLTVIVPGSEIKEKLGNPIIFNADSSTENSSMKRSTPLFQLKRNFLSSMFWV